MQQRQPDEWLGLLAGVAVAAVPCAVLHYAAEMAAAAVAVMDPSAGEVTAEWTVAGTGTDCDDGGDGSGVETVGKHDCSAETREDSKRW